VTGSGLSLPATGSVSDETVAFAAELIDRSGTAPVIEAALTHPAGRPRPLPARAVLAALLCLALCDRPLFLTDTTRLLFCRSQMLPVASGRSPAPPPRTGRSWPPTAASGTASTPSCPWPTPRHCRKTGASPLMSSPQRHRSWSRRRPGRQGTGSRA